MYYFIVYLKSASVRSEQPSFLNDSKDYPFGAPQFSGPQTPSTASYDYTGPGLDQPVSNGQSGYNQDDSFVQDPSDCSSQHQYGNIIIVFLLLYVIEYNGSLLYDI